jgi:hypothetical protein
MSLQSNKTRCSRGARQSSAHMGVVKDRYLYLVAIQEYGVRLPLNPDFEVIPLSRWQRRLRRQRLGRLIVDRSGSMDGKAVRHTQFVDLHFEAELNGDVRGVVVILRVSSK